MEGVKGGGLTSKYYQQDRHYGPKFTFPTTTSTTTMKTTQIINDVITTTAESVTKIKEVLTDILTNANNTQENTTRANIINSTLIDETVGSNATSATDDKTSILNNIFNTTEDGGADVLQNNITTILNATEDDVITSTDNVFNYITTTVASFATPDSENDDHSHNMYVSYHKTTYIIMGVLIAILILIGVVLITMYMSYKKKNSAHISSHYHNQTSREIPTLDETMIEQQSKC